MSDPAVNSQQQETRAKLVSIILAACEELNATLKTPVDVSQGADARLYGSQGALDSLALVSMIVAVEQSIADEFNVPVGLADERAMSQRNSPFKSVGSLADYAQGLLAEAGAPAKE
jgi:D-alanine--poly(phosphoribitol) ligase subunit 2